MRPSVCLTHLPPSLSLHSEEEEEDYEAGDVGSSRCGELVAHPEELGLRFLQRRLSHPHSPLLAAATACAFSALSPLSGSASELLASRTEEDDVDCTIIERGDTKI